MDATTVFASLIRFLQYITCKRVVNFLRLNFSYYLCLLTGKCKTITAFPVSVSIETSAWCNLSCSQCPAGIKSISRQKYFADIDCFLRLTDQLKDKIMVMQFYFQGEPFLFEGIYQMIAYAHQNKIFTIASTNGHYLTPENCRKIIESGLDRLIVSLDGTSDETYRIYRVNGNFEKVCNGIQTMVAEKQKLKSKFPLVETQFLVFRHNQHQINSFKKLSASLGADRYTVKTAQFIDFEAGLLPPDIAKYSRYNKTADGWKIKRKLKNHCYRQWSSCVITSDGWVIPCCFDKNAKYKFGNICHHSFLSVWKSPQNFQFRNMVRKNTCMIDICQNCPQTS